MEGKEVIIYQIFPYKFQGKSCPMRLLTMFYLVILRVEYEKKLNTHDGLYFIMWFRSYYLNCLFHSQSNHGECLHQLIDVDTEAQRVLVTYPYYLIADSNNELKLSLSKIRNTGTILIEDGVY